MKIVNQTIDRALKRLGYVEFSILATEYTREHRSSGL
jgi:hypothetical protein